jgi:hypothetical protein
MVIKNSKGVDDDLQKLESDIRMYKIEFEQYFGGGKKRPPNDTEWRIEQMMKRYGDRSAELSYGQRFHYGNLTQTYVKFRGIFRKRLKKREEASVRQDRHFGEAARKIEAERAAARRKPPSMPAVAVTCSDPAREPQNVEKIYAAFREASNLAGESGGVISRQQFEQFLRQKTEQLRKQKGSQEVEFVVSVEGGRAHLKARVRS